MTPMSDPSPSVIVLAGVNGAGKTTSSRALLAETVGVRTFVNADFIAQGLAGFDRESVASEASRVMLERLRALAARGANFGFETTLAGRSYAPWLRKLRGSGYAIHLVYFWLRSVDLAVARVALRVRAGGHHVPEATIRQRYPRTAHNFFHLYRPVVSTWQVYDNSRMGAPELVASGDATRPKTILNDLVWEQMQAEAAK
jgi:predicted ABC-type ATPase